MSTMEQERNGRPAVTEVDTAEEDSAHDRLDPERTEEAAELTGGAAVDAHVEFVAAQYGEMDHMGGY